MEFIQVGECTVATYSDGSQYWRLISTGEVHRTDGPAVRYPDGTQEWYCNGQRHRLDGPAIITANHGDKFWYRHGLKHRDDGPAVELACGAKQWYQNGLLHRLDGPAAEVEGLIKDWYFEGKRIKCNSQEEFERLLKLKAFW